MKINEFKKKMKSKINKSLTMPDIRSCLNFTATIVTGMDIQLNIVSRNQAIFVVDFVVELVITKMYVVQGFIMTAKNQMTRRMVVMMDLSEELPFTVQDSSLEYRSRRSMRRLIYLIWKTVHHHGIFESNARGGVLKYVDHCFRISRVPYLSLIFVLKYIVGSSLLLVIHGSKLTNPHILLAK